MIDPGPLLGLFPAAMAVAPDEATRLALAVARAGLAAHSLAPAHTHTGLNASQTHNALHQRLGLTVSSDDMASRPGLLAQVNTALAEVFPARPDPATGLDFHEPAPCRGGAFYAAEHSSLFTPMAGLFGLVRECSAAMMHEVGVFG